MGLEHFEPGDLRIRRWGDVGDGTAFTNYFKPGQVLFGKRRAYQRKVAVADFEGVCSGDIYVFEPKDKRLLPELLPFICQTEAFFDYAIGTSAGSLSPRTNWKSLAQYEFALPPLEAQNTIVRKLNTIDELDTALEVATEKIGLLSASLIEHTVTKSITHVELRDIVSEVSYGSSTRANSSKLGTPILRIPNVLREELDMSDLKWVNLSPTELEKYSVRDGDILIVRTNGNPEYVGRSVIASNPPRPLVFASYLIRLRVDQKKADPNYISSIWNSASIRRKIRGDVRSSAGNFNLNSEGIRRQKIPLPSLSAQKEIDLRSGPKN